jgi:hypothetical protein
MQTPVSEHLFSELIEGETRLGPEEEITRKESTTEVSQGISFTISMSAGIRRKGFKILRDIITRHRRSWAAQHLNSYLRVRWESEIKAAANAFNLLLGEKSGKAPTLKQFAKFAALPTNHWFEGNVSGLYRAISEKCPTEPIQTTLMPKDKAAFVRRVLGKLPSLQFQMFEGRISDASAQDYYRKELAELAIKFVQMEEALGRPPEMKEIGEKFLYRAKVLSAEEGEAWNIYSDVIHAAMNAAK